MRNSGREGALMANKQNYKCRHCRFFMADGKYSLTGTCNNEDKAKKKSFIYCNSKACDGFDKEGGNNGK